MSALELLKAIVAHIDEHGSLDIRKPESLLLLSQLREYCK